MNVTISYSTNFTIRLMYYSSDRNELENKRHSLGVRNKISYNSRVYRFEIQKTSIVFPELLNLRNTHPDADDALEYLYHREKRRKQGYINRRRTAKIDHKYIQKWEEIRGKKS